MAAFSRDVEFIGLRLFTPAGRLVADSNVINDRIVERRLPEAPRPPNEANDRAAMQIPPLSDWRPEHTLAQEREQLAKDLKSKGMAVTEMPASELEKIRSSVQPVIDKNTDTVGADFAKSFYGELQKFRSAKR